MANFFHFTAKFLTNKTAYGYDISGEVYEGSGPIAQEHNQTQKNLRDTAEPQDKHQTPKNPINFARDSDAEKQFPELKDRNNQKFMPVRQK